MRSLRTSFLVGFWLFLMSGVVLAEDPVQMLDQVTSQVISELKANRAELKRNPSKLYGLVNHLIIPHVDFAEMGRWVVGRTVWQQSDAALQESFIQEFKTLVVRTYASSLLGYSDQQIEFLPMRKSAGERVQVSSLIKESGKSPLHLDYRLLREGDGWRVYDIIIEGVSIVQGYRAQFANDARRGGLTAVIEKIRQHNQSRGGSNR